MEFNQFLDGLLIMATIELYTTICNPDVNGISIQTADKKNVGAIIDSHCRGIHVVRPSWENFSL